MSDRDMRLASFFGGYFNEDWNLGPIESWEDVVRKYIHEAPRNEAETLRDDLRSWLTETATLSSSAQALPADFGCEYDPADDDLSQRAWLERMATYVEAHLTN